MGFSHRIAPERQLAEVVGKSSVNLADCLEAMHCLSEDPDFRGDYHVLVDLREIAFRPSADDARAVADALGALKSHFTGRVGVVVAGGFMFGMTRMTSLFAEMAGFDMTPFLDYGEAKAWVQSGGAAGNTGPVA